MMGSVLKYKLSLDMMISDQLSYSFRGMKNRVNHRTKDREREILIIESIYLDIVTVKGKEVISN
jgi:CII-binding regulator of phage lambda lysogenization HflD